MENAEKKISELGKAWLKKEVRPYKRAILFLTLLTVLSTFLSLAFAYLVRYLINSASQGQGKLLLIFSAVLLGTLLLRIALQTLNGYLSERLRAKMVAELRVRMFEKILRSEYALVQKYHSGELLNRLTSDIQEVAADSVGLLPSIVGMVVQCLGAIAALFTIDPFFTCIYIVCGGIFGSLTAVFRRYIKKSHKEVLEADGQSKAFMQEGVASVMTIKAYGAEKQSAQKAKSFADNYYDKRMKRNVLRSSMGAIFSLLSNFGLIFAVVWCSVSVLQGNTDYGSVLSVVLLLMQLQHPLSAFSAVIPVYYARIASGERLQEIEGIGLEMLADLSENLPALYQKTQSLVFENVAFSYGRETVLSNVNVTLKKGEIVCLTGASGSGKSTLFKLLLQAYVPTFGEIRLVKTDGEKLTAVSAKERGLFAYVPQGKFLFSGTIYENLTFFLKEKEEEVVKEKLEEALRVACAEFVNDLPQGLQTMLGENGVGLSEGQMQRLAVARAILSQHPVLLLDEATSALDEETERKLLENVRALKDRTCLIVTHRPAALEIADRVLIVEKGEIREKIK